MNVLKLDDGGSSFLRNVCIDPAELHLHNHGRETLGPDEVTVRRFSVVLCRCCTKIPTCAVEFQFL
jgi:hypothetical protein